jgi:hypothetical protein
MNGGARETFKFQGRLANEERLFNGMFSALKNPNPSRGTKITHAKFLCLLPALQNNNVTSARKASLIAANKEEFEDVYYKDMLFSILEGQSS